MNCGLSEKSKGQPEDGGIEDGRIEEMKIRKHFAGEKHLQTLLLWMAHVNRQIKRAKKWKRKKKGEERILRGGERVNICMETPTQTRRFIPNGNTPKWKEVTETILLILTSIYAQINIGTAHRSTMKGEKRSGKSSVVNHFKWSKLGKKNNCLCCGSS